MVLHAIAGYLLSVTPSTLSAENNSRVPWALLDLVNEPLAKHCEVSRPMVQSLLALATGVARIVTSVVDNRDLDVESWYGDTVRSLATRCETESKRAGGKCARKRSASSGK
jgi:hypothetical protein